MSQTRQRHLLKAGSSVSDFRLRLLDGGGLSAGADQLCGAEATLRDLIAKGPALLAFFKVSCPVCQLTLPFLERIRSSGRLPIFAVSQNDAEDTRTFQHRFSVALPTLLDSEKDGFPVSNAFGIASVPTLFLVEKDCSVSRVGTRSRSIAWVNWQA